MLIGLIDMCLNLSTSATSMSVYSLFPNFPLKPVQKFQMYSVKIEDVYKIGTLKG